MSEESGPISLRNRTVAALIGSFVTSFTVNPFDVARIRMQQASAIEHLRPGATAGRTPPLQAYTLPANPSLTNLGGASARRSAQTASAVHPLNSAQFSSQLGKLGVDVCCRDVFWFPSSVGYCVAARADPCKAATKPQSTLGLMRSIARSEGVATLWRGVSLLLVQAVPANVVYFISYEHLRDQMGPAIGQQLTPLAAGGVARALASTIVSPLELLKTRVQSVNVSGPPGSANGGGGGSASVGSQSIGGASSTAIRHPNAMSLATRSIREMVATDGWRALWSGLGLTLWRDVPFSSIYWLVIEAMRGWLPPSQSHAETFAQAFASGIAGGVVASVVTTPFDVAKTRRQLGHSACTSNRMNILRFMRTIAAHDGAGALFVGMAPRTLKVAPACAIMITSYEMGKRLLPR